MRRWVRILLPPILAIFATAWLQLHGKQLAEPHSYGTADIGGKFTLLDTKGMAVTDDTFRGKPMLVYMGYTGCPDICPMTLANLSDTLKLLGPDSDKLSVIFITLDAVHDTPAVLANYLSHFDNRITGLTGSPEQVDKVAKEYKAYAKRTGVAATGKTLIDHSGYIYLMDAKGVYVTHFEGNAKPAEIAAAVKKLF